MPYELRQVIDLDWSSAVVTATGETTDYGVEGAPALCDVSDIRLKEVELFGVVYSRAQLVVLMGEQGASWLEANIVSKSNIDSFEKVEPNG